MKIGAIYNTEAFNVNYRVTVPLGLLSQRGHSVVLAELGKGKVLLAGQLADCDVVHVYRRAEPAVAKCVGELRRRGVGITWDNDDDPRLIPAESPSFKELGGFQGERDFRAQAKIMQRAHVVTTTSEVLAERYRQAGAGEVVVIDNYLDERQFARDARTHDGIVIGWVAGLEHRTDVHHLGLTPVLREVLERDPRVRVVTAGVKLDLDPGRYTHHARIPFDQLGAALRQFDIGIAPLADIPFNHARSDVKVKEYAAAGVPWVASDRGPYARLGSRCGGLTIADDAWAATLVSLAGARIRRAQLRRRAEAWGKSQHIAQHVDRWEAVLRSAAEQAQRQVA
jgi:glycosyltransferase involved in cell wall biosynthesis